MELTFSATATWSGSGRRGEGRMRVSAHEILVSAPEQMGGKGTGTSPEELLLAAVCSCYSATLFRVLERHSLPIKELRVRAEGLVSDYPGAPRFARIVVHPVVLGGDTRHLSQYQEHAEEARDRCFIGQAIRGNVSYEVGQVSCETEV